MRASISTWRIGMSIFAIICWISSSLDGMSVTNNLIGALFEEHAAARRNRFRVGTPPPPEVDSPVKRLAISSALV
jgi:hypothetical protein